MKIVIEVSDEVIVKCKSLDDVLNSFTHELSCNNLALYQHIFNLGVKQGWIEADEHYDDYHCPSCDGHRCDYP